MAAYLLTYNPKLWHWGNIQECVEAIRQVGYHAGSWTCGSTRRIAPGDRLFIIQLAVRRRGIFASGRATSAVYAAPHWIESKRLQGQVCRCVDFHLDALLDPDHDPIFPYERLMDDYPQVRWGARSSGVGIPDAVADPLEAAWQRFLAESRAVSD